MFFLTGGSAMILGFCEVFGSPKGWFAEQMRHVRWEGLAQRRPAPAPTRRSRTSSDTGTGPSIRTT